MSFQDFHDNGPYKLYMVDDALHVIINEFPQVTAQIFWIKDGFARK